MAQQQNNSPLLRIIVPVVFLLIGALVVVSQMTPPGGDGDENAAQSEPETQPPAEDSDGPGTPDEPDPPAEDAVVAPDALTDRQRAIGFQPGDRILAVQGKKPDDFEDVATAITSLVEGELAIDIERGGEAQTLTYAVTPDPGEGDAPGPADADPLADLAPVFGDAVDPITIGSKEAEKKYELVAEINPYRACIHQAVLVNEYLKVDRKEQYVLLHPIDLSMGENKYPTIGSYAASYLTINGQRIKLWEQDKETGDWSGHWVVESATEDAVTLSLTVEGGPAGARAGVVKVTRAFRVAPESHTVQLEQSVENLTDKPLKVKWEQLAQGDVHYETNDYLRGRSRQYVTGYFRDGYDPDRFSIYVEDGFIARPDLISKVGKKKWSTVWPNPKVGKKQNTLAWLATENRYFVVISSAMTDPGLAETGDVTALETVYPTIKTTVYPDKKAAPDMSDDERAVLFFLVSPELELEPGKATAPAALSLDLFVGPREDTIFARAPYKAMRFSKTIRYSLGGFCGFCTFQWLANLLLSFLELLHRVTFDWGIAIVILVLVVRVLLHPITKRGQINMMKMGKQMAAIQPEMEKLKKKYADEPRQMQQAQMQLFREKGINPAAGALGCLPMLLQMPIWIALYAMLYYAIELRHEPAFYSVFQAFFDWPFLSDLSSADRFIALLPDDGTYVINLLFIRLDYSAINILPILMGVTFFINMKFTTPPPMNEQQATQQKIMRIMPILFPFFLYSAPAGLTLYICASTLAGIVDSYIVRKHVKELEESGELLKPKERKPGGFMDRLQKAAEAKQQQMEEMKKQQQKNKGPQNKKRRKR